MGVLDELLFDHADSRRTLQPLHLHVLLQQVVKATNFAKQGGESDFVLQWGDRVLRLVVGEYAARLLSTSLSPSVSCSRLDALHTRSSKLPLSPAVSRCLSISKTRPKFTPPTTMLSVVELMQAASCADALHHEQIRAMVSSMQAEAILHQVRKQLHGHAWAHTRARARAHTTTTTTTTQQQQHHHYQGDPKKSLMKARQGFELSPGVSSFGCVFRCVVGLPTPEIHAEAERAIIDLVRSTQAQAQRNSKHDVHPSLVVR